MKTASAINTHRLIAVLMNVVIVALIICFVIKTDSDKAPVIFMFYYPLPVLLNLLGFIVLRELKKAESDIYKQIVLGLILFFIPLTVCIS